LNQTIWLKACSASILLFSSCQKNSNSLEGKWSFNTLQGAYAELWLDGKSLLPVKSDTRQPYVFDYSQKGDTIILYEQGQRGDKQYEIDRFLIEEYNGEKVTILQDTVHNDLQLISSEIFHIKNTQTYRDSVLLDFDTRAQSEK